MQKRMLFKIGVTLVLGVGIILFYLVNVQEIEKDAVLKHSPFDEQELLQSNVKHLVVNVDDVGGNSLVDNRKVFKDIEVTQQPIEFEKEKLRIQQTFRSDVDELGSDQTNKPVEMKESNLFIFKEKNLLPVLQGESLQLPTGVAVHLCVVVCGERKEETMVMLKSAAHITPTSVPLILHIISETGSQKYFQEQLERWPQLHRQRLTYYIYNISFPEEDTSDTWKKLFKPCASQRLFLPELLQTVDSLIYVDTDTLFLRSLADLWAHFTQMNQSQLAGVVSEAEDGTAGWYNRFANHPYYGQYGINSGVMLMNLTRMRRTTWLTDMQVFYDKYKLMIPWGDQDLINIYFSAHPDQLYLMPCPWNYRNDHCKYMSNCRLAELEGVFVLHGSRRVFYQNKEPALAAVFETFQNFELRESVDESLVRALESKLHSAKPSNCGKVSYIFLTQLKKSLPALSESAKVHHHVVEEADVVEEIRSDMMDDQRVDGQRDSRSDNSVGAPKQAGVLAVKANPGDSQDNVDALNGGVKKKPFDFRQGVNAAISNYQNDAYNYYDDELKNKIVMSQG